VLVNVRAAILSRPFFIVTDMLIIDMKTAPEYLTS